MGVLGVMTGKYGEGDLQGRPGYVDTGLYMVLLVYTSPGLLFVHPEYDCLLLFTVRAMDACVRGSMAFGVERGLYLAAIAYVVASWVPYFAIDSTTVLKYGELDTSGVNNFPDGLVYVVHGV